jgi:TPR repeat protein
VQHRVKALFAGGVLALAMIGVAAAGPFDDAVAAYQRGDYAMAFQILRPLAEQGNAFAQNNLGMAYSHAKF